jgi:hypothetical protein
MLQLILYISFVVGILGLYQSNTEKDPWSSWEEDSSLFEGN